MKQQPTNDFHIGVVAIAFAVILTGCATESTVRVEPQRIVQQKYDEVSKQEFVGFADDRAFVVVTHIPFAPWSIPKTDIWWCPIHELSQEQLAILKTRIKVPKEPNPKTRN